MSASVAALPVTTDSPSLPFDRNNTLGALLVGGLVAAAFWGVTSVQTYIYYQRYPGDPFLMKLAIAVLWALDTFDACLTSHILYHYLVINYANPASVMIPVWSIIVHTAVTSITETIIRCLFSRRVWGLSDRNMILTSIVWIISFCDLVIGLTIVAKAFQLSSWSQLVTLGPLFYANFVAGVGGDLYVALVLCYYLFKSRTGFKGTDRLVNSIIKYVVTTGLLTSVDAILGTVFYAVMPGNYVFAAFYFNLAKLYTNSYLALLNARSRLRKHGDGPVSIHLSGLSGDPQFATGFTESLTEPPTPGGAIKVLHQGLEIAVHTTVEQTEEAVGRAV